MAGHPPFPQRARSSIPRRRAAHDNTVEISRRSVGGPLADNSMDSNPSRTRSGRKMLRPSAQAAGLKNEAP